MIFTEDLAHGWKSKMYTSPFLVLLKLFGRASQLLQWSNSVRVLHLVPPRSSQGLRVSVMSKRRARTELEIDSAPGLASLAR
jgi:hypothetical protein